VTAASKTWSHSTELTEEQRENCRRESAKRRSRPRLGQSGPLTGQQGFVGKSCAKASTGLGKLLEAGEEAGSRLRKGGCRRPKEEPVLQVQQRQRVPRATWERPKSTIRPPCWHHDRTARVYRRLSQCCRRPQGSFGRTTQQGPRDPRGAPAHTHARWKQDQANRRRMRSICAACTSSSGSVQTR